MNREELLKIAKPILFNTEMTQATLENRKGATRRVAKTKAVNLYRSQTGNLCGTFENNPIGDKIQIIKPRYKVGGVYYIQETWKCTSFSDKTQALAIRFKVGGQTKAWFDSKERYEKFEKFYFKNGWQSPYFMPKEAARLFLKVTDVRVERLQDITSEQAKNEGVDLKSGTPFPKATARDCHGAKDGLSMYQSKFVILWDSTIKKQNLDKYGWEANPWVWVIEFERVII